MFKFQRKKPFIGDEKLSDQQNVFLLALSEKLYYLYPRFKKQVENGVILAISANPLGRKGSFSFTLDSMKWNSLCVKTEMNFKILGITAKSKDGQKVNIEISTTEGLIIGFFSSTELDFVDLSSIDVSSLYVKYFPNPDIEEIPGIFKILRPYSGKLDLSTCSKIIIQEKEYFTIKDIGNGDYVSVDRNGAVYKMFHDPFQILLIFKSLDELVMLLDENHVDSYFS